VRLDDAYYLDREVLEENAPSELSCGAADSAEEEAAAALLLGMGLPAAAQPCTQAPAAATAAPPRSPRAAAPGSVKFRCSACRQPAVLRGEKRPTFFCASCPSKGGAQKRAQRALHGPGDALVSVAEATELLQRARGGGSAHQLHAQAAREAAAAAVPQVGIINIPRNISQKSSPCITLPQTPPPAIANPKPL
jgi:hypothetical protein